MSTCAKCGAEVPAGAAFCGACGTRQDTPGHSGRLYHYTPHPHIEKRKQRVPKAQEEPAENLGPIGRFNAFLAVKITNGVGTMWCAYVFAAIALVSLPEAVKGGTAPLIAWIAQTFLQLVLLSIIIVGQKVAGAASENRAIDTYRDAEAILSEAVEIQKHLMAQDAALQQLIASFPVQERPHPEG